MGKKIELQKDDSAIIIHGNCDVTLYTPDMNEEIENEDIQDSAFLAAIIGIMLKMDDKEFSELMKRKAEEYFFTALEEDDAGSND